MALEQEMLHQPDQSGKGPIIPVTGGVKLGKPYSRHPIRPDGFQKAEQSIGSQSKRYRLRNGREKDGVENIAIDVHKHAVRFRQLRLNRTKNCLRIPEKVHHGKCTLKVFANGVTRQKQIAMTEIDQRRERARTMTKEIAMR